MSKKPKETKLNMLNCTSLEKTWDQSFLRFGHKWTKKSKTFKKVLKINQVKT